MRRPNTHADGNAIGWIATSDLLLLVVALFVALAVAWGAGLGRRAREADTFRRDAEAARREADDQRRRAEAAERDADAAKTDLLAQAARVRAADELTRRFGGLDEAARLAAEAGGLRDRASALEREAREAERLRRRSEKLAGELTAAKRRVAALERQASGEGELRKRILGLDGSLDRTVFVIDDSGSMNTAGRWDWTILTASRWIELLPVKHAAVVTFSETARTVPPGQTGLLEMTPPNRRSLISGLAGLRARGQSTNTLAALTLSMEGLGGVDAVVLFTDGRPENGRDRPADLAQGIYRYVEAHQKRTGRKVPVHCIGLGNYFDAECAKFLLELSGRTGGSFIGR